MQYLTVYFLTEICAKYFKMSIFFFYKYLYFQDAEKGVPLNPKDLPCMNCKLIEMGSMACYTELCPDCNRPPPVAPASPSPTLLPKCRNQCMEPKTLE